MARTKYKLSMQTINRLEALRLAKAIRRAGRKAKVIKNYGLVNGKQYYNVWAQEV
jgi:hypothetical protein